GLGLRDRPGDRDRRRLGPRHRRLKRARLVRGAAYSRQVGALQVIDEATAETVRQVCDAIVPGSARVRPEVYVDALLARMDEGTRGAAIEAFYSDFVAPGVDATGAWEEIDFNTPLATRLQKDWSYLGIS